MLITLLIEAIESDEYKSIGISLCDYIDENTVLFGEKYGLLINEFENNNIIKASARHEKLLTLEDILRVSKYLLKNNGRLAMVHRTERLMEILFLMKKYNIEPKKIRFVYPNNAKNSDLVLIEGTLNGKSGLKIMNPLFVYVKKDVYSKEVKDMFGE